MPFNRALSLLGVTLDEVALFKFIPLANGGFTQWVTLKNGLIYFVRDNDTVELMGVSCE